MGNRPIKDLKTLLATFVHTNVNGLTADPSIRILGDDEPDAIANGEIVLTQQSSSSPINFGSKRHNNYFIDGYISFEDASDDQTIIEIVDEMTSLMNVNNISSSKTYEFQFEMTSYNANYIIGQIDFIISAKELFVSAIA